MVDRPMAQVNPTGGRTAEQQQAYNETVQSLVDAGVIKPTEQIERATGGAVQSPDTAPEELTAPDGTISPTTETRPLAPGDRTFTVKEGWNPAERDANGNVTVYTDESGMRWYTPYSTPWQQGYLHDEPGVHADNPVAAAPYIPVKGADGVSRMITKPEAIALNELRDKDPSAYIDQLASMGIAPEGAEYIGGLGDAIQYSTPVQRAEVQTAGREAAQQRKEQVGFLTTVLPNMPEEYQKAYKAGDAVEVSRLATQYQKEYDDWWKANGAWVDANIRSDDYLSGIEREKGINEALAAYDKRQADLAAIEARATKRSLDESIATALTKEPVKGIDASTLTSMDVTKAYRDLNARIAEIVRDNPDATGDDRARLIEDSDEYKQYTAIQKVAGENPGFETQHLYDIGREALSFGKVQTPTYNKLDIERQYYQQKEITLATFLGDKNKLSVLRDKGYFGKGEEADKAYNDALNAIKQQDDLKTAVASGDVLSLNKLYEEGALGDDIESYQNIRTYMEQGGRELSSITADDIKAVDKAFGTKEEYVKGVVDAQPTLGYLAGEFGIALVPVWGTVHNWDRMGGAMKAVSIAGDIAVIVPIVGGIAAASKVAATAGKMARVAALTKAVPTVVARELIDSVNPFPLLSSVGSATKVAAKMILDPRRIPYTALGAVGLVNRGKEFVSTSLRLDYVPLRSMSDQASTMRVWFSPEKLDAMRAAGVTEQNIIDAGTDLNKQLMSGKDVASVELGGVKTTIKNVEYQKMMGSTNRVSMFQGTPDITLIDRGGSVPLFKDFYLAAKAAVEPIQRSYLEGRRATRPGIIEVIADDPAILAEIAPQRKLINSGTVLEPEGVILGRTLDNPGYRLEPVPGAKGRGMTFDASVGPVEIRRYTLSRVVDNPTGLKTETLGGRASTGTVAIGDLHATSNFRAVFEDINSAFDQPVIKGNPDVPDSWNWSGEKQSIVILGDTIDRGDYYELWRKTFNRLSDEAGSTGGRVERVLGNHELAYISKDKIPGTDSLGNIITDTMRSQLRSGILDDIKSGKVRAAIASDGTLFTHAGVSAGVFPSLRGKSAEFAAKYLNKILDNAVAKDKYKGKMFAKGRTEKGHSLLKNEREQGGIFWMRPQEAETKELDLGFQQVVGHNPGPDVRRVWNSNFVEVDVSRRTGGRGFYANTPYARTIPVDITTVAIPGRTAKLNVVSATKLRARAMADTVADFFLGWDGRSYAINTMIENEKQLQATLKNLKAEYKIRKAAGDSIGAKFVKRQMNEMVKPSGGDYLYGGIGFWRDIVMGRQNGVKVLDSLGSAPHNALLGAVDDIYRFRSKVSSLSSSDIARIFGMSKIELLRILDTRGLRSVKDAYLRESLRPKLETLVRAVDDSLDRNIRPYFDRETVLGRYLDTYQKALDEYRSGDRIITETYYVPTTEQRIPYDTTYRTPDAPDRTPRVTGTRTPERAVRTPDINRTPYLGLRTIDVPTRVPDVPRTPRVPPPTYVSPPVKSPTPIIPVKTRIVAASPAGSMIPEGSITWAQGELASGKNRVNRPIWKYIPPEDFGTAAKPRTLMYPPHGAKNTESIVPSETIQIIGKSRKGIPAKISLDLGWADVEVLNGTDIRYVSGGEDTNVGTRLASNTMGMSVSDNVPKSRKIVNLDEFEDEEVIPKKKVVYRTSMSKQKPARKKSSASEFIGDVSVSSIRRITGL